MRDQLVAALQGWALTYLLHSTIIIAVVWAATRSRRLPDAARDALWRVALVGGVLTATAQALLPRAPLAGRLELEPPAARPTTIAATFATRDVRRVHVPLPPAAAARGMAERGIAERGIAERGIAERARIFMVRHPGLGPTQALLLSGWMVGAGLGLLWLLAAHARLTRALGPRQPPRGAVARPLLAFLARTGVGGRVRLSISPAIASPVALPGGEVCLPRRALIELADDQRAGILAHEVAHVLRRDPEWLLLARVIEAVLFFQPLNRLVRRRMQEVAEYLCDDWAVQRTGCPVTFARCLAAVAEWLTAAPRVALAPAMVESAGSPLVERVRRILEPGAREGGARHRGHAASARVVLATGALALALVAGAAPQVAVGRAPLPAPPAELFIERVVLHGVDPAATLDTVLAFTTHRVSRERPVVRFIAAKPR